MTSNTPFTLGDVIQTARKAQQMNMRDFADELGVSQNIVSLWERNVNDVDEARLVAWFADKREWVQGMAIEIFVIKYRQLLMITKADSGLVNGTHRSS